MVKKKLKKVILGMALKILRSYFKNSNYSIFLFDRTKKEIRPFLWFPRYLPKKNDESTKSATNDWINFKDQFSYDDTVVFDVGAAVGSTSRLFSKKASKVYSFEPNLENFNAFKDIIFIEKINNIELYNFAVSNQNSDLKFYNRESHGIHSLGKHPKGKVLEISNITTIKLDDFYRKNFYNNEKIGLLKIDTEGFEYEVLDGAKDLLKNKTITSIIFEHSKSLLDTLGKDANLVFKLLEEYEYKVYDYNGNLFDYTKDSYNEISDFFATIK
tara:strand:+ start:150 stop:962 length:813 start_codon:yes stop_codon:yes gene_type:complete